MSSSAGADRPGSESPPGEKKIIVDEDWKSRVEEERKQAERKQAAAGEAASTAAAAASGPAAGAKKTGPAHPLPPADLTTLVTMLATQALALLGALPNPLTGKSEVDLSPAQHFIDLIDAIQQKTRGNVTPQESAMLDNLLHELRMAYIAAEETPAPAPAKQ